MLKELLQVDLCEETQLGSWEEGVAQQLDWRVQFCQEGGEEALDL